MPFLSMTIWLPIIVGVLLPLSTHLWKWKRSSYMTAAFITSLMTFGCALYVYANFDPYSTEMQYQEILDTWQHSLVSYRLGVDGLSLSLLLLNCFITSLVIWMIPQQQSGYIIYTALFLAMSGLMNGAFVAQDAILFYVFFEASLIPLYFLIGRWGGDNRLYASMKFFLYTLFGSVLLLFSILFLLTLGQSGDLDILSASSLPENIQIVLAIAMFIAFAIKIPMCFLHTWLPDAHVEAPTGGSIILAAIGLKLGSYGFLRLLLPILPLGASYIAPIAVVLSLSAIIYAACLALVQKDMKKLVAYSSIAHMGFVTLGIFIGDEWGIQGAIVQMISHGLISAALFLCVGILYDRTHTRLIDDYAGTAQSMPIFACFFLFFMMANCGVPGTSGFVGECLVMISAMQYSFVVSMIAALSLILSACYCLWLYKRIFWGQTVGKSSQGLSDLTTREWVAMCILTFSVLGLGFYPKPLTDMTHTVVKQLILISQESTGL